MSQPVFFPANNSPNVVDGNLEVTGDAVVDSNFNVKGTSSLGNAIATNLSVTSSASLPFNTTIDNTIVVLPQCFISLDLSSSAINWETGT